LLTFIVASGYYITPTLVGGPADQMLSYFIAFYANTTINWGMSSALALILLLCIMVLYAAVGRVIGIDRVAGIG
jgi:putative spermidine/putrescine transport system permease protein